MSEDARPLPPGGRIGILGSGQLGRMLAMAAARLGFSTHIYADASGPAFDVATASSVGAYDDARALARFAAGVDVVTYEFENVPVAAAEAMAYSAPVRPGPEALRVAQDRLVEKRYIHGLGVPVAPFWPVDSLSDLDAAMAALGGAGLLKTRRFGYDGQGQAAVADLPSARDAFARLGGGSLILEARLAFDSEASVIVARGTDGAKAFYDIPANTHQGGILRRSVVPSGLSEERLGEARAIAGRIADALYYVGVLAVELFVMGAGAGGGPGLVVNEIAPRVHNSGHWTIEACAASQFENHIRAIAGWPLGSTERLADAEMVNLIGGEVNRWQAHAGEPSTAVHIYGKREAREGRKMGHINRLRPLSGG